MNNKFIYKVEAWYRGTTSELDDYRKITYKYRNSSQR